MATDKKTLFHSELKKLGPVRVLVKSEPTKSKYKGRPDYVVLEIDGAERYYNAENQGCSDFFRGQNGRVMTILAEGGGKGEEASATISWMGDAVETNGQPSNQPPNNPPATSKPPPPLNNPSPAKSNQPPPRSDAAPAKSSAPPPPASQSEEVAFKNARLFIGRRLGLRKLCVEAAVQFKKEFEERYGVPFKDEFFWPMVTSLYMSAEQEGLAIRKGFADAFPAGYHFRPEETAK